MAIQTPITSSPPYEAPCATPLALAFAAFLPMLAAFVDAERELEEVQGAFNPAYGAWERDADIAQTRMTAALVDLRRTPVRTREDHLLVRMSLLIDALLSAETPRGFHDLHRGMQRVFFSSFQLKGFGPRACQVNALVLQSRHLIDAMMALPLFERWTDPDLTEMANEDPAAAAEFCPV